MTDRPDQPVLETFVRELSALTRKHGLVLDGYIDETMIVRPVDEGDGAYLISGDSTIEYVSIASCEREIADGDSDIEYGKILGGKAGKNWQSLGESRKERAKDRLERVRALIGEIT